MTRTIIAKVSILLLFVGTATAKEKNWVLVGNDNAENTVFLDVNNINFGNAYGIIYTRTELREAVSGALSIHETHEINCKNNTHRLLKAYWYDSHNTTGSIVYEQGARAELPIYPNTVEKKEKLYVCNN